MSRKCKICSSIFKDDVNKLLEKNQYTFNAIADILQSKGFAVSTSTVRKHAKEHTNYEFKTNEYEEINQDNINNQSGIDINININDFYSKYNIDISQLEDLDYKGIVTTNKNFFRLNVLLIYKVYAIVDKFLDLSLYGDFKFPEEKIKTLSNLHKINNDLISNIKDFAEIECVGELVEISARLVEDYDNGKTDFNEVIKFFREWENDFGEILRNNRDYMARSLLRS